MSTTGAEDTIVAIATAPGRGALAIVRVSGPRALDIARPLVRPFPEQARRATRASVHDADGQPLDDAVVVAYHAPSSFSGEDTVEVTTHGGALTAALVTAAFVAAGARPALPGEFTRRAVLNGRLDIVQAEAIGDLVDAGTRASHRVALNQLDGGLSRRIVALRERVLALEALCAYDIDFPEEDDGPVPRERILQNAHETVAAIDALLLTAPVGEIVREGAVVVIAGAPNVGKSSLFNAMLGRRRAIVTDIPGTTRDALEAVTEADAWPIRLIDTAGLRESTDVVERLGIEVSREYLERADVVLACGDSEPAVRAVLDAVAGASRHVLVVRTKADLLPGPALRDDGAIPVSAETGEGLARLASAIARTLDATNGTLTLDAPLVTRERQRAGLQHARDELHHFRTAWEHDALPATVAAVHLRDAARALEELIGVIDVEDVLDRLFSSFCVGK